MTSPLFNFNDDRQYLVAEVCRRAYSHFLTEARNGSERGLEYLLNDAAYREVERLQVERGPEEEVRPISWWRKLSKRLGDVSEKEKRHLLRELIETYTEDIAGSFDPRVYKFATQALPVGLSMLFKAQDIKGMPGRMLKFYRELQKLRDISERIVITGHTDTLQQLAERGTLVVVPTHSSNMDSILMGWSLFEAGLPPVTYGAGKNLFTNPLTSFFMKNLGAYRVDRRLRHDLYKDILKIYSQVLLERGYHSLFFPGGTRNRSNKIEQHLKLGLLGTAISAYVHNLMHYEAERPIYICPVTINYNLVLEAESLIRDHLRREGGRRYFLEEDEFNQISSVVRFTMKTVRMESTTVVRFGEPMDPFGNRVGPGGNSYDRRGRRLDPTSFVRSAKTGEVVHDSARDREYTRHTGKRIAQAFLKNTVVMPTQVVAWVLFELLSKEFPQWDVYELLRLAGEEIIPRYRARAAMAVLLEELRERESRGELRLAPIVREAEPGAVLEAGANHLGQYHVPAAVERRGDGFMLRKLELLYYYGNRLRPFELDTEDILERARRRE